MSRTSSTASAVGKLSRSFSRRDEGRTVVIVDEESSAGMELEVRSDQGMLRGEFIHRGEKSSIILAIVCVV